MTAGHVVAMVLVYLAAVVAGGAFIYASAVVAGLFWNGIARLLRSLRRRDEKIEREARSRGEREPFYDDRQGRT